MPIAISDKRLLDGIHAVTQNAMALPLGGEPAVIRDLAASLLEGGHETFGRAVGKEDLEEVSEVEARTNLRQHRKNLDEGFTRLYLGLHSGVLARRLAGDDDAAVKDLTVYLEAQNPSGFAGAGLDAAIATAERALGFADRFLPDDVRDAVRGYASQALTDCKAARDALKKESTEAITAHAELERMRQIASESYLAARDLLSAALRLDAKHHKLSQLAPGLHEILTGGAVPASGVETPTPVEG